ncbi:MAG: type II toxin-antitoxin system HipA family toxin, partial [Candidatus Thiodiazotropha sp. (ex Dulcina madagascariensis)]|nr:type II toxin-antitoxin system HipA family toxin [Candidatus Thiodiazotropha sp. (ex Dulcina madagascariensis)]
MPISLDRRDLAMICGDWGRYAHVGNLVSQSERFYLRKDQAMRIIADMEEQVAATWYDTARRTGVSEQ